MLYSDRGNGQTLGQRSSSSSKSQDFSADPTSKRPPQKRPASQRTRIRKLFSRVLDRDEVDFLLAVWKAGSVRDTDCPAVVAFLLKRGWIERHGHRVRLSQQTEQLIAEVRP